MAKKTQKKATAKAATNNQKKSNTKAKKPQEQIVLAHMKRCSRKGITSMEAFSKYGITRLSGRIFELRKKGYDIITIRERTKEGTSYGRYVLGKKKNV